MSKSIKEVFTHPQKVRLLYKTILKLHRGLPLELKALGDQYIKDEFRRHKDIPKDQMYTFMVEWTNYAITLTEQLGLKGLKSSKPIGDALKESELDHFSDEQVQQLYELYKEASNTSEDQSNDSKT